MCWFDMCKDQQVNRMRQLSWKNKSHAVKFGGLRAQLKVEDAISATWCDGIRRDRKDGGWCGLSMLGHKADCVRFDADV